MICPNYQYITVECEFDQTNLKKLRNMPKNIKSWYENVRIALTVAELDKSNRIESNQFWSHLESAGGPGSGLVDVIENDRFWQGSSKSNFKW